MNLQSYDLKWRTYLRGDSCPAVLGLAPLSEEESKVISSLVAGELRGRHGSTWQAFLNLLFSFPGCLAVWLARKAGEAYEAGAFWEKFGSMIGVDIPLNQRAEFAMRFRLICKKTMAAWHPPQELGGHNIVAEFLHEAGLPLDRCAGFAQHVRKVERSLGLPDADAEDAGEQLCEAVLESLQSTPVPTLKRALRGPAGPRICEVALGVVLNADYEGINPLLGKELARVFAESGHSSLRRSARQPFLRLSEDLGSLEIVGPRQDASLVGPNGLTWVVDGQRYPTPRSDEFIFTATDQRRVSIELSGLLLGALPPRPFVLNLNDMAVPFMLFDERARRQHRVSGPVPAGNYWLLHRRDDRVIGTDQSYEWSDDEGSLSFLQVLPGTDIALESDRGGTWQFTAARAPFFAATGERIIDESREVICYSWMQMPFVWLPIEEADSEGIGQWHVALVDAKFQHTWRVSSTGEDAGGMVKCFVEAGGHLTTLLSGLHRFKFSLRRGERSNADVEAEYWYWHGLTAHVSHGFQLSSSPLNLIRRECQGFRFGGGAISHLSDQHRRHILAFEVEGYAVTFHWAQPGVFVESFEKRPGKQIVIRSHTLGDVFSASLSSDRWIRIWIVGQRDWRVVVEGKVWHRDIPDDRRAFVELSLAALATAIPEGGEIRLQTRSGEHLLGRFSSPIQPLGVDAADSDTHFGFRFHFSERILWVRPVIRELASGQTRMLDSCQFGPSGNCVFVADLPAIECSNLVDSKRGAGFGYPVTLRVLKQGWPEGLWLIELAVQRDENGDDQVVTLHGRDHVPIVVAVRDNHLESTARSRLLWASFDSGTQFPVISLDESGSVQLFELLTDLIGLHQTGIDIAANRGMGWLKNAVRSLSQLAGRIARQVQSAGLQPRLLELACRDSSHLGFVYLPSLLGLPASEYRELPSGDPLNDSLRWCGRFAVSDTVAGAVRNDFNFLDVSVIGCFANFANVVGTQNEETSFIEFSRFAHERYWQRVLGRIQCDCLVSDWAGENALGKAHLLWALGEMVRRYEGDTHDLNLAAANALLHRASSFRAWLFHRLGPESLMSLAAWGAPWPQLVAPDSDFLESAPRFASLFALAARSAAAGLLEFDEALTWLESHVDRRSMAEEGIAVLVSLAPELFGHQLLFWELIVRTAPH